ncbi:MAG: WXG100 family type VII secretion target [Chloroflexi bacterium CFX4]|nr:WXG100 family type VII secretion target [Chloroflexi bacterium CFX4]MDL1923120.1 WXG100 family type VII secretion target [Chloroflexi bacterium CFX3]
MGASHIRMDYEAGKECSACFSGSAESIRGLLNSLQRQMEHLQGGAWRGRGANAFYMEMKDFVLPSVSRLVAALEEACHCTGTLAERFQAAEREAGALFVGGEGAFEAVSAGDGYMLASYAKPFEREGVYQEGDGKDSDGDGVPDTAQDRSETYAEWHEDLANDSSTRKDIKFYAAAALVTNLLGGAADKLDVAILMAFFPSVPVWGLLQMLGQSLVDPNHEALAHYIAQSIIESKPLNDFIGEELFRLNERIYNLLRGGRFEIAGTDLLISPHQGYGGVDILSYLENGYTVNADGQLLDPDGNIVMQNGSPLQVKTVSSALEWDIAMVMREQTEVGGLLNNNPLSNDQKNQGVLGNNYLLGMSSVFEPSILAEIGKVLGADFTVVNWAKNALSSAGMTLVGNGNLNFDEIHHRVAIGIAMVFQQHGYSEAAYVAYVQQVVAQNQQNFDAPLLYTPDGSQPAPPQR